jgi:hypothetical protein
MRASLIDRLRREDGIALVLSLGITSVLIIFVASMIDYTTSNSRAVRLSSSSLAAMQYADAGLNTAYSILVNQKVTTGGNPTAANLLLAPDILIDYTNSDPGPKHACVGSGLGTTAFDGDTTQNGTNTPFELLPNSSYTCVSANGGAATGQLSWNNSTKVLSVNGNVFLDGNLTISQSGTYTGTGVIEAAGTITFNGNGTALCATSPCSFTTWQGTSSNTSMLTLVALKSTATSITFTDNAQTFQGSIWCQPSSSMTFVKNGVTIEGPISIGKFDATFNNASFQPLPVIKNMPVGAPIPPNTGASIGTLTITR